MTDIQPLLINSSDTGGSATASRRIHEGLRQIGVDSRMLVQQKSGDDPTIDGPNSTIGQAWSLARPHVDMLPLRLYGQTDGFAVNWLPERMNRQIEEIDPDVVHLNWVWRGAMSIRSIGQIDRPVVWRLPDMAALTGGCHYAAGCDKFTDTCGNCPQLDSTRSWDLSRLTWHRKDRAWAELDVTIVAPCEWLADQANQSSLFGDCQIEVIQNGLNIDTYRPRDPSVGRDIFDLPMDKQLILFGAVDPIGDRRKGADLLQDALRSLALDSPENVELVMFGASEPAESLNFTFPTHYTGFLYDDASLALLYSAADAMIVPSRYEGFGQTVFESLACGTPVIGFDATGPKDQIDHRKTGWLAEPYNPKDLAAGIRWVLEDSNSDLITERARETAVKRYDHEEVAQRYLELYSRICD